MHGVAQSVSSASRTLGPVLTEYIFGAGLGVGIVGSAWWSLAGVAAAGVMASALVREGTGQEIFLEGEQGPRKKRGLRG